jgi:hypothetical protein
LDEIYKIVLKNRSVIIGNYSSNGTVLKNRFGNVIARETPPPLKMVKQRDLGKLSRGPNGAFRNQFRDEIGFKIQKAQINTKRLEDEQRYNGIIYCIIHIFNATQCAYVNVEINQKLRLN